MASREITHPNEDAFPPGLGGPALRALANAGIRSKAQLARLSEAELAALHGVGPAAIRVLKAGLASQKRRMRREATPSKR